MASRSSLRSMDSGIISYIRAFGVRWFVAMSGGLGVPLTIASYFVAPDAAKVILFLTGVVCIIFSSYWIWKVEREARIKAEELVNNRENRKNVRMALSAFLMDGQTLMSRCDDQTVPPPNDDANAWQQETETFLLNSLDESYIVRFRDGSGIMPAVRVQRELPSLPHVNLWSKLYKRVVRLHEFITELSI
jgi:hypothetical protein